MRAGWSDLSASTAGNDFNGNPPRSSQKLRANTTPHERTLWRALKELPIEGTHFRRQAPIGRHVVDFFCPAKRLIIELDGGHHNDDETAKRDNEGKRGWKRKGTYPFLEFRCNR